MSGMQNSQGPVYSLKKYIHSLNKCLLIPCYVPGTILGEEDKMAKQHKAPGL